MSDDDGFQRALERGAVEALMGIAGPKASFRHSWAKLREHAYICRKCGMGRVNAQRPDGQWFTTFHKPDGRSVVAIHVPPCEKGPRTARYLSAHLGAQ